MGYVDTQATHNPTTGQVIPASWGDIVRDDLEYLGRNYPHSRVFNSGNITLTTATLTVVTFNSERVDVGALHSTVSNTGRFTITDPGFYEIGGGALFAGSATGTRSLKIRLNGATTLASTTLAGLAGGNEFGIYTEYQLAAGDYVELIAYQDSGGNLNITASGNYSPECFIAWKCV